MHLLCTVDELDRTYRIARDALLAERRAEGYWEGELSTSALSTATAVGAFALVDRAGGAAEHSALIEGGLRWLVKHQNADGGWGDTVNSLSNISTTMLCRAAIALAGRPAWAIEALNRGTAYLDSLCRQGAVHHAEAIRRRYGKDRTFSAPILMMSALAELVDWREVPPLPFELACLPQVWFRFLRLHVVSYALPALIAIGQAVHHHQPSRNPLIRMARRLAGRPSLRVLERIQPSSGGFLEATPLTSFVTMALASIGQHGHSVVRKALAFLRAGVRPDGSWPIDSNLSVWVTTLAINALAAAGDLERLDRQEELAGWLLAQQGKQRHPYTGAAPGGWGWTHLPGSVPDADDTPGALLALRHLAETGTRNSPQMLEAIAAGRRWLLDLQNADGGWPTFCSGWGNLPFDRSGPDLTAHALRALRDALDGSGREAQRVRRAMDAGFSYLARTQREDGSWLPLWFGNQRAVDDENPTYGTARVLAAYREYGLLDAEPAQRGTAWLLSVQNADGSWGGGKGIPGTIEETALALESLVDLPGVAVCTEPAASGSDQASGCTPLQEAVARGLSWLCTVVQEGTLKDAQPIGFYFAKLWYFEKRNRGRVERLEYRDHPRCRAGGQAFRQAEETEHRPSQGGT